MTAEDVLVVDAEVDGRRVDLRWRAGRVVAVEDHRGGRHRASVTTARRVIEVDAAGGALVPGLHDHHLHLHALAAADQSVAVGPLEVGDAAGFIRVLTSARDAATDGWIRAVGYHESVAGDLDAGRLDDLVPVGAEVAIRVQHRSGQLWVLNRRAIVDVDLDSLDDPGVERDAAGRPTGRVFGLDHVLGERLPQRTPDLATTLRGLAGYGVTGVTDMTPTESPGATELLAAAALDPTCPIRVTISGGPRLDPDIAPGLPRGPVKLLPPDHATVDLDGLIRGIRAARALGRTVAIHCVTRVGAAVAVAALQTTGTVPGDRIEHGAVLDDGLLSALAELGLIVVTQPNFVAERGEQYTRDVDPDDLAHLWRCATLPSRGVPVAGGTDAPYGHRDPWRAIRAAVERRTPAGVVLGPDERIGPTAALRLFLGSPATPAVPRRLTPGSASDLCLLDRPLGDALAAPGAGVVQATIGRAGVVERSGAAATRSSRADHEVWVR